MTPDEAQLVGQWAHAHEQDADGAQAYVRADAPLPPSRGRTRWDFAADGSARRTRPGPTDRPEADEGTWRLADGRLEIRLHDGSRPVYNLADVGSDRLMMTVAPSAEEEQ